MEKQPAKVNRKDYVYCVDCEGYILRKNLVERSGSFFSDDTAVTGDDPSGSVQRIRIYDGALTAAEVGNLNGAAGTPEPASYAMLATGLSILGLLRRKRSARL